MAKKILFIEDDEAFFTTFSIPLVAKGYNIIHVADGMDGFNKVLLEKPDLVLLDIMLPGVSGLDILKEVKNNEDTKSIPILMMTNYSTDANVTRAMELGAEDYFMKYNVVPDELPLKIAQILGEESTGINVV